MTIVQEGFRWRYDDGNEANATWRAAQDSNITLPLNTPVRLRTILDVAANPSPAASYYRLEFKEANETTYTAVAVGGNKAVTMSVSGNIASGGEASTVQLIAPSGKTTANFAVGRVWDDENGLDAITIGDGKYTELEWCVTCNGSVAAIGNVFSFRATRKDVVATGIAPDRGEVVTVLDDVDTQQLHFVFNSPVVANQVVMIAVGVRANNNTDNFGLISDPTQFDGTATIEAAIRHRVDVRHTGSESFMTGIWSIRILTGGTIDLSASLAGLTAGATNRNGVAAAYNNMSVSGSREAAVNGANGSSTAVNTGNVTLPGAGLIFACSHERTTSTTITPDAAFFELGQTPNVFSAVDQLTATGLTNAGKWTYGATAQWSASAAAIKAKTE